MANSMENTFHLQKCPPFFLLIKYCMQLMICPLLPVKADTSRFALVQSNLKLCTSLSDDFLDKIGFGNSVWWKRRHQFETKQYRPQCLSIDSKLHLLSDKFVGQMCET